MDFPMPRGGEAEVMGRVRGTFGSKSRFRRRGYSRKPKGEWRLEPLCESAEVFEPGVNLPSTNQMGYLAYALSPLYVAGVASATLGDKRMVLDALQGTISAFLVDSNTNDQGHPACVSWIWKRVRMTAAALKAHAVAFDTELRTEHGLVAHSSSDPAMQRSDVMRSGHAFLAPRIHQTFDSLGAPQQIVTTYSDSPRYVVRIPYPKRPNMIIDGSTECLACYISMKTPGTNGAQLGNWYLGFEAPEFRARWRDVK